MKRGKSAPPGSDDPPTAAAARQPSGQRRRRTPVALEMSPPPRPPPTGEDDFQDHVNGLLKQIDARLNDITFDYLKLQSVVEDQMTEIKKAPKQKDIHEASGKVMEECEKLNKKTNDRLSFIVTQTEQALVQTATTESSLEAHLTGAFAKAEANFAALKERMDNLPKDKSMDTDGADAKETDLHLRATLRRLERRVQELESSRDTPKEDPEPNADPKDRDPDVSNLFREFGNLRADFRILKESKKVNQGTEEVKGGGTKASKEDGSCHCIHVDQLELTISEAEVEIDLLKKSHAAMKEELRELKSGGRAPLIPPRSQQEQAQDGSGHGPRSAPQGYWNAKAPEFQPPGGEGPASEDYPMWSYTDDIHYGKVFDDKVAMNSEYQFGTNGCADGEKWRLQIRGYWIARIPFLMAVLDWVEKHENVNVTQASLQQAAVRLRWPDHVDYQKVNGIIWGFLNMCLKGEAKSRFRQAPTLNGLEGWRLIVGEIRRGKDVHLSKLRNIIRSPKPITKIDDVNHGITCFENAIAEYIDAGGERPSDQEMKSDLLDVLPGEVSVHVMWQVTDPTQSYHAFSNHIRSQANSIVYHQGRRRGAAHMVDDKQREGNESMEDEVNAVYRKWGAQRPNGGPRPPPPRRDDPSSGPPGPRPSNDRPMRCVNCGDEGHMARECPKPQVAFKDRPCYLCGKTGHLARDCRSRGGGRAPARLVEEGTGTDVSFGGVVEYQEEKPRPRPQARTLDKFMPTKIQNSFEALSVEGKPDAAAPPPPAPHPERRIRKRVPFDKRPPPLSTVRFADPCACCPTKSCSAPNSEVPKPDQPPSPQTRDEPP